MSWKTIVHVNDSELYFIAYVTIKSNKIASNRQVYGLDRGNNPEVTRKLSGYILLC